MSPSRVSGGSEGSICCHRPGRARILNRAFSGRSRVSSLVRTRSARRFAREGGHASRSESIGFLVAHPHADSQARSRSDPSAHDAYTLALLIHSLFNPTHPPPPTSLPPHPAPQPSSRGAIPAALFPAFKRMLNPNPKTRLTAEGLLNEGGRPEEGRKGFFGGNRFLWIVQGLDGWALKGESERSDLLK